MEKTKELATMIQMFLKIKYNKDISVDNIIANIKVFEDNKFCYNCHSFIGSNPVSPAKNILKRG